MLSRIRVHLALAVRRASLTTASTRCRGIKRQECRLPGCELTTKPTMDLAIDRTHPEDRTHLRQIIDRASIERTGFSTERRLMMPDGTVKYIRVVAHRTAGE